MDVNVESRTAMHKSVPACAVSLFRDEAVAKQGVASTACRARASGIAPPQAGVLGEGLNGTPKLPVCKVCGLAAQSVVANRSKDRA